MEPAARRQGLARELLMALAQRLRGSNDAARALYCRFCGWSPPPAARGWRVSC
ncbi:hypothetical protein C0U44_32225, partial [Klebsiella pneumoniae]